MIAMLGPRGTFTVATLMAVVLLAALSLAVIVWVASKLFRAPTVHPYAAALDARWSAYERWRDAQVCVGCGAAFKDKGDAQWVTEFECMKCFRERAAAGKKTVLPSGYDEIKSMFRSH